MSLLLALVSQSGSINLVASDLTVANTSTQGAIVVVKDTIASSVLQSSFSSSNAITVVKVTTSNANTTVNSSATGVINLTHNLTAVGAQQSAAISASSISRIITVTGDSSVCNNIVGTPD